MDCEGGDEQMWDPPRTDLNVGGPSQIPEHTKVDFRQERPTAATDEFRGFDPSHPVESIAVSLSPPSVANDVCAPCSTSGSDPGLFSPLKPVDSIPSQWHHATCDKPEVADDDSVNPTSPVQSVCVAPTIELQHWPLAPARSESLKRRRAAIAHIYTDILCCPPPRATCTLASTSEHNSTSQKVSESVSIESLLSYAQRNLESAP
eukprot:m.339310 g.339310  ORF g.339310 m.339310 type:complete len:205 (+) comp16542_c1_seq19:66-680(+)